MPSAACRCARARIRRPIRRARLPPSRRPAATDSTSASTSCSAASICRRGRSTKPCRSSSRVVERSAIAGRRRHPLVDGAGRRGSVGRGGRDARKGRFAENPESFRAQLRLAEVYEQDEQWNEAADALARAQALNPRAPMIARRRAVALLSAGRAPESRDLLQATMASGRADGKDPILLYLLAESQRVDQGSRCGEGHRGKAHRGQPRGRARRCTCCRSSCRTRATSRAPRRRSGT